MRTRILSRRVSNPRIRAELLRMLGIEHDKLRQHARTESGWQRWLGGKWCDVSTWLVTQARMAAWEKRDQGQMQTAAREME